MRRRSALPLVVLGLVCSSTTGCLQLGEYAMGSECQDFSERVVELADETLGIDSRIDQMWAGEGDVRCSFDLLTGTDLASGDAARIDLQARVQELTEQTFDSGVEVTLVYESDSDFVVLNTRENIFRAECTEIAEQVEDVVVSRYGDDAYVFAVRIVLNDGFTEGCSFDLLTGEALAAGDPQRVATRDAVSALLPTNTEANLVYADGRDTVVHSTRPAGTPTDAG